jgi:hypothetical protein
VKEIYERAQSLSDVLASRVNKGDGAERAKRAVLRRFVFVRISYWSAYPSLRRLEEIIEKLEPLSEEHVHVKFLHSVEAAKSLTGFVEELANAFTEYQVRAAGPTVIFTKHPARFRSNKECTRGRGVPTMTQRTPLIIPSPPIMMPGTPMKIRGISR